MRGLTGTYKSNKSRKWAAYMRRWRAKNCVRASEISRAANAKLRKEKPMTVLRHHTKYNDRLRAEIVAFFGGCCAHCGFADPRALQMDHINGGGTADRKTNRLSLHYRWKLVTEQPVATRERFQLLCANCNVIKRHDRREYGNGGWAKRRKAIA